MPDITWSEHDVQIKDLQEYSKNPRSISKVAFERLVSSLKEHGYNNRMLVDTDNIIIGGHARRRALLKAGYKETDFIKVLKPNRKLSDQEFKRLNVRDNGSFGDFDLDLLSFDFEIPELIDLGVPEFLFKDMEEEEEVEAEELDEDIEEDEDSTEALDEIPDEPEVPITQSGYTWILGNHKLHCGDSLNPNNHARLFKDQKADFCFIDPPYGIKIDEWDNPIDVAQCLKLVDQSTKADTFFAFTHQMPLILDWLIELKDTPFKFKDHIVWVKRTNSSSVGEILRTHETIMIYRKGKKDYVETKGKYSDLKPCGLMFDLININSIKRYISDLHMKIKKGYGTKMTRSGANKVYQYMTAKEDMSPEHAKFTNVWSFLPNNKANKDKDNRLDHPTIKPILLTQRLVELCCDKGELVMDMFLGSGTTLIACESSNRVCYGFEMSPKYCDIIINRWQKLTGCQAILQETNQTYDELKAQMEGA
jgi:DNA modification methylase